MRDVLDAAGDDGVLALLDLGSASLALDLALDELGEPLRSRVRVTEAPFVEGAVLAAVAAASGAGLAAVAEAAERAPLMPKLARD
jgi:PTS hybrid protein